MVLSLLQAKSSSDPLAVLPRWRALLTFPPTCWLQIVRCEGGVEEGNIRVIQHARRLAGRKVHALRPTLDSSSITDSWLLCPPAAMYPCATHRDVGCHVRSWTTVVLRLLVSNLSVWWLYTQ